MDARKVDKALIKRRRYGEPRDTRDTRASYLKYVYFTKSGMVLELCLIQT